MATESLVTGTIIDSPEGPLVVQQVLTPLGRTYAVLTPWNPMWVEVVGDEFRPVSEADMPILNAVLMTQVKS